MLCVMAAIIKPHMSSKINVTVDPNNNNNNKKIRIKKNGQKIIITFPVNQALKLGLGTKTTRSMAYQHWQLHWGFGVGSYLLARWCAGLSYCIAFYNVMISSACWFWYLNVRQFVKTEKHLSANRYSMQYSNVSNECFVDAFSQPLVFYFDILVSAVVILILISLSLQTILWLRTCCGCNNKMYKVFNSSLKYILFLLALATVIAALLSVFSFLFGFV
ncbi:hypothetical protein RFI_09486 [Reticulomyxa filosa]|uniref:Uncharacterized protein n=1 Tax=Reticulomyxa filosa TaxID=46433 RepID=X6NQK6_RETFI|nr:hypothetical protein RFI_09486 [Reticulomyxa filosa]|eukprot:ETO27647.1 hypothetical protein RFI_09486 [Reticulomyxa filosa]